MLGSRAKQSQEEHRRRDSDGDPREPAESNEQAAKKNEVRRGDEWQRGSGCPPREPSVSLSAPGNHSRNSAIEARRFLAIRPAAAPLAVLQPDR